MESTSSFSLVTDDCMQRNSAKLHQKRFRLDFKKNVFTMMVVKHWNSLPRKVVNAPCLSVLKRCLDNDLNTML